jgi:hypothetical protein
MSVSSVAYPDTICVMPVRMVHAVGVAVASGN